jgi:hypothetical protein
MIIIIVLLLTIIAFGVMPDFMQEALSVIVTAAFWLLFVGGFIFFIIYATGGLS